MLATFGGIEFKIPVSLNFGMELSPKEAKLLIKNFN